MKLTGKKRMREKDKHTVVMQVEYYTGKRTKDGTHITLWKDAALKDFAPFFF
jgi:hypothetical protein